MNVTIQQTGNFGQGGDKVMYRQDMPDTKDGLLALAKRNFGGMIQESAEEQHHKDPEIAIPRF